MPRYRLIPTGIPTSSDLRATLTSMGLRNVEAHATPTPLDDWIGRPTDVMADVIIRRDSIGASSDDMGFVRNASGTYDALVSEIHLFRFDRKWFEDLAKRSGVALPTEGPRQFAESTTSPAPSPSRPAPAPSPAASLRDDGEIQRAQLVAAEVLEKARNSQRLGQLGCSTYFLPALAWFAAGAAGKHVPLPTVFAIGVAWTFVWFVLLIVVFALRFQKFVSELAHRLPKGSEARRAAITRLQTIAADKTHDARLMAGRLAAKLEGETGVRIKPRPPQPRGPGASKP